MANEKLVQFISQSMKLGKSKENIQNELVNVGWAQQDITDAFTKVSSSQKQKKRISSPLNILEESLKIYTASFFRIISVMCVFLVPNLLYGLVGIGILEAANLMIFIVYASIFIGLLLPVIAFLMISGLEIYLIKILKDFPIKITVRNTFKTPRKNFIYFLIVQLLYCLSIFLFNNISYSFLSEFFFLVILITFWFLLIKFIIITEDLSLVSSIKKSTHYLKGNIFTIFVRQIPLLVVSLIAFFPMIADSYPYLEGPVVKFLYAYTEIVPLLFIPLLYIYQYVIYKFLKDNIKNTITVKRKILDFATIVGVWILISIIVFMKSEIFYWLFY